MICASTTYPSTRKCTTKSSPAPARPQKHSPPRGIYPAIQADRQPLGRRCGTWRREGGVRCMREWRRKIGGPERRLFHLLRADQTCHVSSGAEVERDIGNEAEGILGRKGKVKIAPANIRSSSAVHMQVKVWSCFWDRGCERKG
eukprot:764498-Hanusia_phi.AAC.1